MKTLTRYCAVLFIGALIGAAAVHVWSRSKIDQLKGELMNELYDAHRTLAYSNLISAVAWRRGDSATLDKYLDVDMLPVGLRFLERHNLEDSSFEYYAWRLKKYYLDNGIEIPAEARPILEHIAAERPKYVGRILEDEAPQPTANANETQPPAPR